MKKWIVLTLFLFCIPALVWGWGTVIMTGSVSGGGGSCDTLAESCTSGSGSGYSLGNISTRKYLSTRFTTSASRSICKIACSLQSVGSPTFSVNAYIYTDNNGEPGSVVGTGSSAVSASSIPTSFSDVEFSNVSATLSSGTVYWVVLVCSSVGDTENKLRWQYGDCFDAEEINSSSDGSTWDTTSTSVSLLFKLYE